jgi:hypothetical protein
MSDASNTDVPPISTHAARPALSVASCLIAFLAELYRQTLAVPGCL